MTADDEPTGSGTSANVDADATSDASPPTNGESAPDDAPDPSASDDAPVSDRVLLLTILVGVVLAVGVAALAGHVVTDGGAVTVEETTIETDGGLELAATVYEPADATAEEPAPGVAAIHGYTVDRTSMENVAIELAHRGYVVVAVDQPGHGASDPPPFANGWGGPATLEAVADRDTVDADRVALVGYSMGGAAALAATDDQPDGYAGVVLQASSPVLTDEAAGDETGVDGVTVDETTPRNVAVVFGSYDELAPSMWGTQPGEVHQSDRLAELIGAEGPIEAGETYGDVTEGTARSYEAPPRTHLGLSLSPTAVAATVEWVDRVTAVDGDGAAANGGEEPTMTATGDGADQAAGPSPDDQRWQWAALGNLAAFVGALAATIGTTALAWRRLGGRRGIDPDRISASVPWRTAAIVAVVPALAYYPLYGLGTVGVPTTRLTPQSLTHGAVVWGLGSVVLAAGLLRWRGADAVDRAGLADLADDRESRRRAVVAAAVGLVTLAALSVLASGVGGGLRAGLVALDPLPPHRAVAFAVYLVPIGVATVALSAALHRLVGPAPTVGRDLGRALAVGCGGLVAFLALQYAPLFAGLGVVEGLGLLMMAALRTTVLLAVVAVVSTLTHRLTGSIWPAGVLAAVVATWMLVAGGTVDVAPF